MEVTYILQQKTAHFGLFEKCGAVATAPFNLRKKPGLFTMRALAWTLIIYYFTLTSFFDIVNGQQFATTAVTNHNNQNRNNSCTLRSNKDCNFCIQSAKCGWCSDPNWTGPRCDNRNWYVIFNKSTL